jgi:hypothetical protein
MTSKIMLPSIPPEPGKRKMQDSHTNARDIAAIIIYCLPVSQAI